MLLPDLEPYLFARLCLKTHHGTEVSSGKSDLTEGVIGFQSEGAEIHFRNIKIKELK